VPHRSKMRKDLKTGILFGLVLSISAIVIMSVWPEENVQTRLSRSRTAGVEVPAAETVPSDQERIESVDADSAAETEPVVELRVAHKEPREGADPEGEQNPKPETVFQNAEDRQPVQIHVVAAGQTLSSISAMYYGTGGRWKKILDANPKVIADQDKLWPGMRLAIPE